MYYFSESVAEGKRSLNKFGNLLNLRDKDQQEGLNQERLNSLALMCTKNALALNINFIDVIIEFNVFKTFKVKF